MAWAMTQVSQYVVSDRRCHVYDCVYSGTGYGGFATGATGPTLNDLGFASTSDSEMYVFAYEALINATGAYGRRDVAYDLANQVLRVGATAGSDISGTKYRVVATGKYQL